MSQPYPGALQAQESNLTENPELTTSTSGSGDLSGQATDSSTSINPSPADSGPSINPIYAEALKTVPPEFHNTLVGHFKRWDDQHTNALKKWESFKAFEGTDPEKIQRWQNVYKAIEDDPVSVYNSMGAELTRLGLVQAAQQQVQQEAQQEQNPETLRQEYVQPQTDDPRLNEIQQQMEQFKQFAQWQISQQQEAAQQQQSQQIEAALLTELKAVEQKWGTGDPNRDTVFMQQVLDRLGAAHKAGTYISPEQAAQQIQTYNDQVIADYVMNRSVAPRIVPANGGIPAEAKIDPANMTPEQSHKYGEWIARGRQGSLNL